MQQLQLQLIPKWILPILFLVALIGFADAGYLTLEHYGNLIPPCTLSSCEVVLTSSYATILGVPVALLGLIYYVSFLVLLVMYFDGKKEKVLRFAFWYSIAGLLFTIYFLIIQAFVLNAFCQYCLVSAATSTLLFIISMYCIARFRTKAIVPTL